MLDKELDGFGGAEKESKSNLLGDRLYSKYSEAPDLFEQEGVDSETMFHAFYARDLEKSGQPDLDMASWAKSTGMDRFLERGKQLELQRKQLREDDLIRQKNLAERGDFARGVASGVDQMQATFGGGLLMGLGKLASYAGGDNVVSKYLTGKGLDVYQEQMRQASLNPTKSLLSDQEGKWINEELKDPGDYFDAIAGTFGNLMPSMAVSLISGGVGGKIAELAGKKAVDKAVGYFVQHQAERMLAKGWGSQLAKSATEGAVANGLASNAARIVGEEAVKKAAQGAAQKYVGQRVGTILGTAALESTGAFAETVNHMREKFLAEGMSPEQALLKATDETSATFAMSTGLAAGMVEIFGGNIRLLDMVLGDMGGKTARELVKAATHARANPGIRGKALNMMRDLMVEAVKQAPAEFGQEAAQEILSMSNVDFADPDFEMVTQDNFKRVLESGLAGAIGGVGGGFATEVGGRAKALVGGQETPESRARDLEVQIARQKDMLARGMDKSLPNLAAALAQNEAEFQTLQQHLGNVKTGVSYQDAVARIGTELPGPDGKPFTTKALKNLIRHGNLEKLEDGTIKPESLEAFIAQKKGMPRQIDPEVQAKAGDVLAVDPAEVAKTPEQAELLQIKTELDAQAHQTAATSPLNNLPEPTEEEKENGDYPVSSVQVGDMNISIENPRGSERKGIDEDGREWSTLMRNHYGYVDGSVGADKDRVDVFLSDEPEKGKVFIINQVNPKTGKFDEHKAMVGFETEEEAREAYLSNYEEGWKGLGSVGVMGHAEFKDWAMSNKAKKPFENSVEEVSTKANTAPDSDLYSSLSSEVEDDFFDDTEHEQLDESYYDSEPASEIEGKTEKQKTVESPNREIFETGIIPREHKIERLGPNEAFVYSQDEGSTADLKGSARAAAQFEAEGGAVVPIRMRRQAKGPDGKPLVTEKGNQVFEFSGTQAVFSDMANLAKHASANPEMKFALSEMGRKAGVHPRLFRSMVQASGLAETANVALSEQLRGEKEKSIPLTSDMLEEMERLAHGIQEGRKRKANTMAVEERLAGLQAGVLQWMADEASDGRDVDRKLAISFIQHVDSYTRAASSWMKYRNKQAVSPAAGAKPERTGESLFDAEDLGDGYLETVDREMSREDVEDANVDTQVNEDDENYMELYLEKRNLFVDTLTEHFGADAVRKFEEYGLFNFDQFAGRRRAVYASESGEAFFDPMKANDKRDVLRMFYHEVGVHHGLESLIKKVVGEEGWDNFKTSILKEMTGRSTQSGDLFRRIYNEVRAVYVDAPDIKSPKFLAMRGKSMQELMMDDSFFHEFLGRVANKHDWTTKKQPSWATWLRDVITRFFRTLGFQLAPTFEEIGHFIQGSVANILAEENRGIAPERLKKANAEAMAKFSGMEDRAEWRTSPEKIDTLAPNQVFVFGSNTAGIHGAGAALQAKNKFGAQPGKGRGMTGQTYALPTKSKIGNKLVTMPLAAIAREVDAFMAYAAAHPDKEFLVTAVGTGLAGYKPVQIAELFNKHTPLPNVLLPASFLGQDQAGPVQARPAPAKPAPAKPVPAKSPLEDGTIPFASVLNRQKKAYGRNATSGRQLTEAERAKQAIEREQSAGALVHTLYGRIAWEEAVDPYELSRQITNLEGFDFTLRPEQTLESAAELGIVLRKPESVAPTVASIQARVNDINRAMATTGLDPANNPVATGAVAQALQDMYSRLAVVADDPVTVDKIYWNATRLKNLVTSAGKLKKKPQFKEDGEKVDVFESDAEHAVRQGNIVMARGHFGHEWSQMIEEIKRWHKAIEDYRSGKADIARLIANMRTAKNRRRHAINEAVKNGALQYGALGRPVKIPSRMAVGLKPVAYLAEKNRQLRVNMDKREATGIRVLAEGTKRALQKIYGAVQRVGSLPGTRMSEKNTAIINEANLSQAEKGFPQEKILGSVSAQFARELVEANQSAVEKDRQRRELIDKQGIESIEFTIPQLKPAADLGALLRRELVGFGNTGQVARRYQALAGKTVKQLVTEVKDGLRRAGLFVEQFAGSVMADHLLLGSNELGSFEAQDQGQIIAGNMKFLDQALAVLGEKYGTKITLRRGAPLPALGNLQLPSGNVVTELAALRRLAELFGEYKGLTVDELFLGVFGLGNPYAENRFVFDNLPETLLEKFVKAGLAERTKKEGVQPVYHLPKDLRAHFGTNYTLYSEIFNLDAPRQATWLDFSIIPSGQGQRLQDMRAFGPGAILMKGEQLFVVGPDYEVREWAEAGKLRYERVFTLNPIVSNISDGKIAGSKIKVEMPTKVDEFSLGDYTIIPRFWDLLPTAAVESTDKETNKVTYKNHYYLGADLLAAVEALGVRQKLDKLVAETGQTGIESTAHTQIVQDADGAQFLVLTNAAHDQLVFKVASGEITVAQKYSDEQAIRLVADELARAGQAMAAPLLTDRPEVHVRALAEVAIQARGRINELLAEGRITSLQAATMTTWMDTAVKHVERIVAKPAMLYRAYEKMGVVSALPRGRQAVEDFLEKHWPEKLYPAYPKFLRGELSESDYMAIITKAVPNILDYQIETSGANLGVVAATIFRLSRLSRDEREAEAQRLLVEAIRNGIDGDYVRTGGRAMSGDADENNFADEDSFGNEGSIRAQAIELASEALVADALLPEADERDELLLQKTLRADLPAPADLNELLNKIHGKGAADALFAVLKKSMPETGWTIEKLMARETPLAPLQTFRLLNFMLALDQGKVASLGLSHSGLRYAAQHAIERINIPMADGSVMAFGRLDEATRGQLLDYVGRGPWFKHIWDSLGAKLDLKKKRALWTRERIEKLAKYLYPYKSAEKGRLGGLLDYFGGESKLDLDSLQIAMAMGGIPLELPYFMQGMPYVDTQAHLAMIRNQLRRSHFVRGSDYAMAQIEKGRQKAEDRKFYDTKYVGKALFEQILREQAAEAAMGRIFNALEGSLDPDVLKEIEATILDRHGITVGDVLGEAPDNIHDFEKLYGRDGRVFVRTGYAGNPYQSALDTAITALGFVQSADEMIDEVITDEFRQPALDGSGLADPMEAGYFIGLDGYRYNMIADAANFSLEEGGSQEVSDHISPTTGDLILAELMNKLEPGSYALDKGGKSGNAGFSPAVMINGKTYSLTKSNPSELSPFGEALLQQLRRRFDEVLAAPQKLLPSERKRVENLAVAFAQYEEAYGKYEAEKLRKKRVLGYGGLRVGPNRKWNKVVEAPNRNLIHLSIIQMLQPFGLWREGDAASIEIHGPDVRADDPRSFSSVWPDDVLDGLRRDRGRTLSDLRAAAGMIDRNGTMHIFTGALIGSDGKLDQRELMKTVFHEFVGHVGLRRLLGAEYEGFMLQVFDRYIRRDLQRSMSRPEMISLAEEFVAGRAERVRFNEQTGKFENSEVGTVFDRIAAMIVRKFRQIMQSMGITVKLTGVEVRDVLRNAFAGSQVAGRTGISAFVPKGFIPMENIGSYADFGKWKGNTVDNILEKTADMLRPWEALVRSITSWDGQTIRGHEDVLYGMRTLKTRIAAAIAHVSDEERAFAAMLSGKQFTYDDLGAVLRALHAKERIKEGIRVDSARYRARLMEKDVVRIINDQLNSLTSYFYNLPDDVRPSDDVIEKKIEKKKKKMQSFHTKEELVSYLVADHYKMISKPSRRIRATGETVTDARYFDGEIGSERAERILKLAEQRGWISVAEDGSLSGSMAAAVRKILEYNMQGLDHALDAEMISREEYEALRAKYRYFIPVRGGKVAQSSLRTSSGFRLDAGNRFSEVFQGGTSIEADNLDPISQTFTNLRTRIGEAETNKMNRTIARFVLAHPNAEVFGVKASKEVLDAAREQLGLAEGSPEWEAIKLKYGFSERAEASIYEQRLFEQDNGLAPAYLDGHLIQIELRHEGLRESYRRFARPERVGRMMQALGKVNRWMTMINTMLAPEFWAGQLTRDPGTALATLSIRERVAGVDGRTFAKQASSRIHPAMKVLYKVNFNKDLSGLSEKERLIHSYIERFEKSGGKIQFAMMETALQVEQNLRELVAVARGEASPGLRAREKVKAGVDLMRKFSDSIENGTRLAVFMTAIENGASEQEAALLSREITVDFDRKGQLGQAINTLYMFSNAGIQGSLTILRTIKNNPERAVKTLSAIVGLSMSVALANLVMGDGDDGEPKIFGISDEVRNNHLVLVIPGLDNVVKIPLPYGYAFFWAIGQELVNALTGRKGAMAASAGVLSSLMNNFNPLETAASLGDAHGWIRMISPTITDPLLDIGMERTPFGTPLMPEKAYEDQPDSSRYWRSVSATSKWAAEGLNELTGGSGGTAGLVSISPETLDSMFETATGGLGKLLSRLTGMIVSPVTGREVGVTDIPILRRFVGEPAKWEDRGRFYDNFEEVQGVNTTFKNLQKNIAAAKTSDLKQASIRDMNAFRFENGHILALRTDANNTYKRAKEIDSQKEMLYKSGLPDSEIQPKLNELNERQRKIYQDFNKRYYEIVDAR